MAPPPRSRMDGTTAFDMRNEPLTLTSKAQSHCSESESIVSLSTI